MIAPASAVPPTQLPLAADEGQPLVIEVVVDHPLAAPMDAEARLPSTADVTLHVSPLPGLPAIDGPAAFEITAISMAGLTIDLTEGYSLSVDHPQAAVFVSNAATHEMLRIWGGELALDGVGPARFWGTTTVVLGNGAVVTLETRQDQQLEEIFHLDRLTVTKEERALVLSGLAAVEEGGLVVQQSFEGYEVDRVTRDGLAIMRDDDLWRDEAGVTVVPETFAQTAPGAAFGPESWWQSEREATLLVSDFLTWDMASLFHAASVRLAKADAGEEPRDNAPARAWERQQMMHLRQTVGLGADPGLVGA